MAREMKDSGFAWIKEIPLDWGVYNLRYKFTFGKGLPITKENLKETGISVISYGQIHSKANTGTTIIPALIRYVDESYLDSNSDSLVHSEDFIFADTSEDIEGCGNCVYVDTDELLFAGYHTIILRSKEKENNRYLAYLFKSDIWRKQIRERVTGVKLFSISQKILRETTIILPPKTEQIKIANFLDAECARINAVIEQTRASIEEYKKLKQAVITQAVTKGIRPNRPMKDSGVDWIGETPDDWHLLRKLSYACDKNISYGIVKLFEPDDENGAKVLRCSDIREGIIDTSNIRTVTQDISHEYSRTILDGGEVLINVRGTLGGCAVVPKEMKGYNIAREVAMVSTNNTLINRYLMYYFLSKAFLTYEEMNLAGSVYIGLNIELLSACPILLPSIPEQIEIANYLDGKCSEINALITKKECFIQELEKYKRSMIYEFVTGKKEVHNASND